VVFLAASAPTGVAAWLITPTIVGCVGYGDFDIQGTFGVSFRHRKRERAWRRELDDTSWSGGLRDGENQIVSTPGIVLGRFELGGRALRRATKRDRGVYLSRLGVATLRRGDRREQTTVRLQVEQGRPIEAVETSDVEGSSLAGDECDERRSNWIRPRWRPD
jgi:hypothetical protein